MQSSSSAEKRILGMPFDFRAPTWERVKARYWNARDPRVFTPKVFGLGWALNLHALARRLHLLRTNRS